MKNDLGHFQNKQQLKCTPFVCILVGLVSCLRLLLLIIHFDNIIDNDVDRWMAWVKYWKHLLLRSLFVCHNFFHLRLRLFWFLFYLALLATMICSMWWQNMCHNPYNRTTVPNIQMYIQAWVYICILTNCTTNIFTVGASFTTVYNQSAALLCPFYGCAAFKRHVGVGFQLKSACHFYLN